MNFLPAMLKGLGPAPEVILGHGPNLPRDGAMGQGLSFRLTPVFVGLQKQIPRSVRSQVSQASAPLAAPADGQLTTLQWVDLGNSVGVFLKSDMDSKWTGAAVIYHN